MNKYLLILIAFFLGACAKQTWNTNVVKFYGEVFDESAVHVCSDGNGSFYIASLYESPVLTGNELQLRAIDSEGNEKWVYTYPHNDSLVLGGVVFLDNKVVVGLSEKDSSTTLYSSSILACSTEGQLVRTISLSDSTNANKMHHLALNEGVLTACVSTEGGDAQFFQYDEGLAFLKQSQEVGIFQQLDNTSATTLINQNLYWLSDVDLNADDLLETRLAKLDVDFGVQYAYDFDAYNNDEERGADLLSSSNSLLLLQNITGNQGRGGRILRVDYNGNLLTNTDVLLSSSSEFSVIKETIDGNYLLAGYMDKGGVGTNFTQAALVKVDARGEILWLSEFGVSENNQFIELFENTDGSIIVFGLVHTANSSTIAAYYLTPTGELAL